MTDCGHEHEDGAYVLGALSPEDRVAFERHLSTCADCARSVRELAGLPGLLARVPVEIVDPEEEPPPVPETLLPALVRQVRESQRRRTWLTSALVAAAAATAIGAVGVSTLGGDDGGRPQAAPTAASTTAAAVQLHQVGTDAISGWLSLTQVGWGTRLDLTCTYAPTGYQGHLPRRVTYALFVRTRDGRTEQVGTWRSLEGRTMRLTAATSTPRANIASVEVRTTDGRPVLHLTV
jgi:hypothetical protein